MFIGNKKKIIIIFLFIIMKKKKENVLYKNEYDEKVLIYMKKIWIFFLIFLFWILFYKIAETTIFNKSYKSYESDLIEIKLIEKRTDLNKVIKKEDILYLLSKTFKNNEFDSCKNLYKDVSLNNDKCWIIEYFKNKNYIEDENYFLPFTWMKRWEFAKLIVRVFELPIHWGESVFEDLWNDLFENYMYRNSLVDNWIIEIKDKNFRTNDELKYGEFYEILSNSIKYLKEKNKKPKSLF